MKILAIDTSSNVATVAVTDDTKLAGEYILNHKKTHSQKIMPMLDEVMKSLEIDVNEIDLFAVVTGPGSFTGLRIGVAAVKALAQVTKKPVVSVDTLEGLAYNLPFCPHLIVPMMDARRSDVYTAVYDNGTSLEKIIRPCAISLEECVEQIKALGKTAVFLGDGAYLHKDYIKEQLGDNALFAPINVNEQRASSVAVCAASKLASGDTMTYSELEPYYIRKSQAEREYEERKNKEN